MTRMALSSYFVPTSQRTGQVNKDTCYFVPVNHVIPPPKSDSRFSNLETPEPWVASPSDGSTRGSTFDTAGSFSCKEKSIQSSLLTLKASLWSRVPLSTLHLRIGSLPNISSGSPEAWLIGIIGLLWPNPDLTRRFIYNKGLLLKDLKWRILSPFS